MRTFPLSLGLAVACLLTQLPADEAPAARAATQPPAATQARWPQKVIVTVGDVRTRIEGPKLWTLSGIDYRGATMAVEDSAYGTVFTIRGVGHLGTAHFLDVPGKPGDVEKENVTRLALFVDGKAVSDFSPEMRPIGKSSFRMERESTIRAIALTSTVDLRDAVLVESVRIRANEPVDLQKGHPLMYAWTPQATVYAFGDDGGVRTRGAFLAAGKGEGKTDVKTVKDARWMAAFDPASGTGSVCYLVTQPADAPASFLLIDAPGVYRKVALMNFVDQVMPAGFDGTYRTAVGFFTASEIDWEKKALERAREVKAVGAELAKQSDQTK